MIIICSVTIIFQVMKKVVHIFAMVLDYNTEVVTIQMISSRSFEGPKFDVISM